MPIAHITNPSLGIGLYENTIESFKLLSKSTLLIGLIVAFMFLSDLFQIMGIKIISLTSAVQRNLLENIRPFFVWLVSTITYYLTAISVAGEQFDKYSLFGILGFIVIQSLYQITMLFL